MASGYYRFPTIHHDAVVFVSEDDLWRVAASGGVARRLTSNLGEVTYPMLSPDGAHLAFVGREEGAPEIYVMPAQGGSARRLTFQSSDCRIVGWSPDGTEILYSSAFGQANRGEYTLFAVDVAARNGQMRALPLGPARTIAYGPLNPETGQMPAVLGRNTGDPARWKRYQGGTAGHLWLDVAGDGQFRRILADLKGNIASPMWLGERIYFISDHEGIGNLYSVAASDPDSAAPRRHTDHEDYYARNPSAGPTESGGWQIVYHAGADLYVFDVATDRSQAVAVDYHSPRVQRNRKFVHAGRYMDGASLEPKGNSVALTSRGKMYAFYNQEGPVFQVGKRDGARYRLAEWLNDGRRLVAVSDESGEEMLEIHSFELGQAPRKLDKVEFGRAVSIRVSPTADKIALTNHRQELFIVDLESQETILVDHSPFRRMAGVDWSPDGRWLVYGHAISPQTTAIRLFRLPNPDAEDEALRPGQTFTITQPILHDVMPAFDPEGKFIYFLSYRVFNPIYDGLHLDLGFPMGMRPYLITLQADQPNPFVPHPADLEEEEDDDEDEDLDDEETDEEEELEGDDDRDDDPAGDDGADPDDDEDLITLHSRLVRLRDADSSDGGPGAGVPIGQPRAKDADAKKEKTDKDRDKKKEKKEPKPLRIDLEGIAQRVLAFPVSEGRFGQIAGVPGKALFTVIPVTGELKDTHEGEEDEPSGELECWNFKEYKAETLVHGIQWFDLSRNHKKMIYGSENRLRVIGAGEKAMPSSSKGRKSGWVDFGRIKVSVDAQSEWEQMVREAWRLQRDQFWSEDMAQVDWQTVYTRYFPLIQRVSSRGEFSDLMWEMQGELGTSHAYEFGGDYRPRPIYSQGFLGATIAWDAEASGYRITDIVRGDPWETGANSPLADPGVDVKEGDLILAINGQPVDAETSPAQLLVNQAGQEVLLVLALRAEDKKEEEKGSGGEEEKEGDNGKPRARLVIVKTLPSESAARYRAWVEGNRRAVHEATGGKVGYLHIPDMGPRALPSSTGAIWPRWSGMR